MAKSVDHGWKRGLPRGPVTPEMLETFEAYFAPGGTKWHRRRTDGEIAAYRSTPQRAAGRG